MTSETYTYKNPSPGSPGGNGLLAGKRVVIQPNISVRGWLVDAGSLALKGYAALEDAAVISRLREAGAGIAGSGRMSELGFGLAGDTTTEPVCRNEAHISLIMDTMGETRVAAAKRGLFGFKPSFGVVSRIGLIGLVPSMECCGIAAKSLKDIVDVAGIISGRDENDFSMPDETPRSLNDIGKPLGASPVVAAPVESFALLDDREAGVFKSMLSRLEKAGCSIREVSFARFNLFRAVHNVIGSVEASSSAGKYDGVRYGHRVFSAKNWNEMYLKTRGEAFGPLIKSYLFQGAYFQYENYSAFENACRVRRRLVEDMESLLDGIDALALPAVRLRHDAVKAATVAETYDAFAHTLPANVTGQPALHIPFPGTDSDGDPGLQLIAPRLGDARLLALGMRISSIDGGNA